MPDYDQNSTSTISTDDEPQTTGAPLGSEPGLEDARIRRTQSTSLAGSITRHPFLALLPAIFLLAAGIVAGGKKHPSFSTSATINVGKSDIITQATPGYVQAAQVLASSYSRVVMSQHVEVPTARAVGESVSEVSSHLSAAPIPDEPTLTITANASSPNAAIKLANAAVKALVHFANVSQTAHGSPSRLLSRYVNAQATADRMHSKAASLQGKLSVGIGSVTQADVTKAQIAAQVASLQAQAYGDAYTTLLQNGVAPVLDVFSPATTATSDHTSNIERYSVVGVVAGLVLGLALAALVAGLENRRATRRLY